MKTPLWSGPGTGRDPGGKALFAGRHDPNAGLNKDGEAALGVAARFGREDVVQALLAQGADLNAKDKKFGATPLIWALR